MFQTTAWQLVSVNLTDLESPKRWPSLAKTTLIMSVLDGSQWMMGAEHKQPCVQRRTHVDCRYGVPGSLKHLLL